MNSRRQGTSSQRDLQETPHSEAEGLLEENSLLPPWSIDAMCGLKVVEGCSLRKDGNIMQKRYYIAYGSNLNIRQMRMRCPHARVIGTAVIKDYELLFKGSLTGAYLTIEPKKGGEVPVAAWEVTESDEAALDRYEGFPTFYYKKEMELDIKGIRTGKIRRRKCFVYIMHEERKIGVPSLSYVSTCLQGYASFGFDEHYLSEAQIKAVEVSGHEE